MNTNTTLCVSPYKTKLNHGNAYWMARISQAIYEKNPQRNNEVNRKQMLASLKEEDSGFEEVIAQNNKSTQSALVVHKNYMTMAFRGTDELADWADNLDFRSKKTKFGKFHKGFLNALNDVWKELFSVYQSKRREFPFRPLFITGHSLGGALATVAAARLAKKDLPFISVYTFGQPRAAHRSSKIALQTDLKDKFFRFQNNSDLVTRIPARIMKYTHVGQCLYITEAGQIQDDPGYWARFLDSVKGSIMNLVNDEAGVEGLNDHKIHAYVDAVKFWNCEL